MENLCQLKGGGGGVELEGKKEGGQQGHKRKEGALAERRRKGLTLAPQEGEGKGCHCNQRQAPSG